MDFGIIAAQAEISLSEIFREIGRIRYENQIKVLDAMRHCGLSDSDFGYVSGYGYNDRGRERLEQIFALVFGTEDALIRHQIISGTHALSVCLTTLLEPGDLLLSVYGKPYDTLLEVIGDNAKTDGSLTSKGVRFDFVNIDDGEKFNESLSAKLRLKPKVCLIQRSRGYSDRKTLTVSEIEDLICKIRKISPESIILTDNCYGEFTETKEPSTAGSDLIAGSLIKNPGGGIAPCGGYIAGKHDLVEKCGYTLTCPGIGRKIGPSLGHTREIALGFFFAPHVVAESHKSAVLCSFMAENAGFDVDPGPYSKRSDIVQTIKFRDREKLITFCQQIQRYSPVDSHAVPVPGDMPGYSDKIIMASGSFTQGSSIELSCDAPLREPFTAYFQGGLFYDHARYALINAFQAIESKVRSVLC